MKIECEIHEFNALQNKAELDSCRREISNLQRENITLINQKENQRQDYYRLEEKIRQLQLGNNPPSDLSLTKISEIFDVYLNTRDEYGNKIATIKKVREICQCGLKEAKDVVEGNFHKL
jgi:ribosomal protein L7/L12